MTEVIDSGGFNTDSWSWYSGPLPNRPSVLSRWWRKAKPSRRYLFRARCPIDPGGSSCRTDLRQVRVILDPHPTVSWKKGHGRSLMNQIQFGRRCHIFGVWFSNLCARDGAYRRIFLSFVVAGLCKALSVKKLGCREIQLSSFLEHWSGGNSVRKITNPVVPKEEMARSFSGVVSRPDRACERVPASPGFRARIGRAKLPLSRGTYNRLGRSLALPIEPRQPYLASKTS